MKNIRFLLFAVIMIIVSCDKEDFEQQRTYIKGETANEEFGSSVSVSSDGLTIVVGAPENEKNGDGSGRVCIYTKQNDKWTKIGDDIFGSSEGEKFGRCVAISPDGSVVAVCGKFENQNGFVRIFQNSDGVLTQIGNDILGDTYPNSFGCSISLNSDGSIIAIGDSENSEYGPEFGKVKIFQNINGSWTLLGNHIEGKDPAEGCGKSVSINSDGTIVAVGSYGYLHDIFYASSVSVYKIVDEVWTQIGTRIDAIAETRWTDISVNLNSNGSILAIGDRYNNENEIETGYARVFQCENEEWVQLGSDIDCGTIVGTKGVLVDLNSDGSVLVCAAYQYDGAGKNAGYVNVYKYEKGIWSQITDIEGKKGDELGRSISINAEGSVLVAGAPGSHFLDLDPGYVVVYKIDN